MMFLAKLFLFLRVCLGGEIISLTHCLDKVCRTWFKSPPRPFAAHAIGIIEDSWNEKNLFLIEAPTGYGKSTISASIALYTLQEELKTIIAFPLRTLLEDQFRKFNQLFDASTLGKRYMHNLGSPYLIKPVTLTTVDTLSLTMFGIPPEELDRVLRNSSWTSMSSTGHYLFSWSSVALANLVLDEVHLLSDCTKSINFLLTLIRSALDNDQKVILMSATLPESFVNAIMDFASDDLSVHIRFHDGLDSDFVADRREKQYEINVSALGEDRFEVIKGWIRERDHSRVLVVFNTIADAVEFYRRIRNDFNGYSKLLLHSRFNGRDREAKAEMLEKIKNREKYIIVSTQIVEAGVDISSDLFITEACPANSLVQRFGRFLRYEGEFEGDAYVWYRVDDSQELRAKNGKYGVYDAELVSRTVGRLKGIRNLHLPENYEKILEVYGPEDFVYSKREIDGLFEVFMNFERGGEKAVEKFIELEGSFVRESLLVPVVDGELLNSCTTDGRVNLEMLTKLCVPVDIRVLKYKPLKAVFTERGGEMKSESSVVRDYRIVDERRYLRDSVNIAAVVVEAEYDSELGLLMG